MGIMCTQPQQQQQQPGEGACCCKQQQPQARGPRRGVALKSAAASEAPLSPPRNFPFSSRCAVSSRQGKALRAGLAVAAAAAATPGWQSARAAAAASPAAAQEVLAACSAAVAACGFTLERHRLPVPPQQREQIA